VTEEQGKLHNKGTRSL